MENEMGAGFVGICWGIVVASSPVILEYGRYKSHLIAIVSYFILGLGFNSCFSGGFRMFDTTSPTCFQHTVIP